MKDETELEIVIWYKKCSGFVINPHGKHESGY